MSDASSMINFSKTAVIAEVSWDVRHLQTCLREVLHRNDELQHQMEILKDENLQEDLRKEVSDKNQVWETRGTDSSSSSLPPTGEQQLVAEKTEKKKIQLDKKELEQETVKLLQEKRTWKLCA
ncbi:hypothetical protein Q8A73_020771 [Channa argus]|nr:hypothetical protein Q8A73_020771 [Channa argus]